MKTIQNPDYAILFKTRNKLIFPFQLVRKLPGIFFQ